MRISDWSSDVCSSDLLLAVRVVAGRVVDGVDRTVGEGFGVERRGLERVAVVPQADRVLGGHAVSPWVAGTGRSARLSSSTNGGPGNRQRSVRHTAPGISLSILRCLALLSGEPSPQTDGRSEEHTSELQSLMSTSY